MIKKLKAPEQYNAVNYPQRELYFLAQEAIEWQKACLKFAAICLLFLVGLLFMMGFDNDRNDREVKAADARVMTMVEELRVARNAAKK